MSWLDVLRYRMRVLTRPTEHARDAADEAEFHLDLETMQRQHASGAGTDDARAAAHRRFGNTTYYREEQRRISGIAFFDALAQDLRFALRAMRRAPTFTIVAVVTLAIGIGANTAIFSAIDALLLRPLPYAHPEQLMSLTLRPPNDRPLPSTYYVAWSLPKLQMVRDGQSVFSSITVWQRSQFTLASDGDAWRVDGEFVDSHYFPTLGISPVLGRGFGAEHDRPETNTNVAVISTELWEKMFNADSSVVGKRVDVDGVPFQVVGVMPAGFKGLTGSVLFWMPLGAMGSAYRALDPDGQSFYALARLAPGASQEHARTVVRELGVRIDAVYPNLRVPTQHWGADARAIDAVRVDENIRRVLYVLFGAAGLVLLIACVNVANLFLVRASARRREIAVRLAIGAGRWRLIRQLLVESLTLSALGGLLSVIVAYGGTRLIVRWQPEYGLGSQSNAGIAATPFEHMTVDSSALVFCALLAVVTGVLFGLVPALQSTRPELIETLKDDGAVRGRRLHGLFSRNALTAVEIALAVVLLAGSGLLVRSLRLLLDVPPGVDVSHVLTIRINRSPAWSKDSLALFYDRSVDALQRIPGVTGVAIADLPPLGGSAGTTVFLDDRAPGESGRERQSRFHYITPEWPTVMRARLVSGRLFTRGDLPNTQKVVLINETAAKRFWPRQDPIGRPVTVSEGQFANDTAYVVGVLGDIAFSGIGSPPVPDVYVSYYQMPFSWRMMMFLRVNGDPLTVVDAARAALRRAAPGFPVYDVRSMDGRAAINVAGPRFMALLVSLFALLALTLAMIGTYGVISYAVAQRTKEIGVRMALGATAGDVSRMVVAQGLSLATVGGVVGLLVALASTRVLKSMLFEIQPGDPKTMLGIIGILLLSVLAASWIPARRAASVPAMQALRGD